MTHGLDHELRTMDALLGARQALRTQVVADEAVLRSLETGLLGVPDGAPSVSVPMQRPRPRWAILGSHRRTV